MNGSRAGDHFEHEMRPLFGPELVPRTPAVQE